MAEILHQLMMDKFIPLFTRVFDTSQVVDVDVGFFLTPVVGYFLQITTRRNRFFHRSPPPKKKNFPPTR